MTTRRPIRAASSAGVRARSTHSLAPAHLGDAAAAATLAVIVGGIALVIAGIGIIAMALTIGGRYGGDPPPNLGSLMLAPALIGAGVLLLGAALAAAGTAVLGRARRAQPIAGALAGVAALLAAATTVLAATSRPPDAVIAASATGAALVFGVAALILLRPRR